MQKNPLEALLEVLKTGNGTDGKRKDVVFAPTLVLEALSKGEMKLLVRSMKETPVRVISFPIRSGQSCDARNIPKRLRKLLGDDCSIGIIHRKKGGDLTFIPAELFKKRWAKDEVVDSHTERVG